MTRVNQSAGEGTDGEGQAGEASLTHEQALTELTALRQRCAALMRSQGPALPPEAFARGIFETAREPLLLLGADLDVRVANRAFYEKFRVRPQETEGRYLTHLGEGQWDIPRLRELLSMATQHDGGFRDFEVEHDFPGVGRMTMMLNARQVSGPGEQVLILLAIEDITDRKRAEAERDELHRELENRVRLRTAELEAANRELESFSYSVSHDLRSPLRALDGYARILMEDHAERMPMEALGYVHDIRRNAQKMGHLIDDLLAFSRLSRQSMRRGTVTPAALVYQALQELDPVRKGRQVDIAVGELPPCQGDPALLKQVWVNLLSNALKYTRKHDPSRIEVSCREEGGEQVYYVRDSGAGFDMRYIGKLFGVFQRLHKVTDYEGTGVGLAIVRRIVERHGGRIWAEGALNQGATFYFTISPPEVRS